MKEKLEGDGRTGQRSDVHVNQPLERRKEHQMGMLVNQNDPHIDTDYTRMIITLATHWERTSSTLTTH